MKCGRAGVQKIVRKSIGEEFGRYPTWGSVSVPGWNPEVFQKTCEKMDLKRDPAKVDQEPEY